MASRLRNPLGSWLLGSGTEGVRRLRWRVQLLLTSLVLVANIIGAVLVSVLLFFVIPGPPILRPELAKVNFLWAPAYAVASFVIGSLWGTTWVMHSLRWAREERKATRAERISTLRGPWKLTLVSGVLWAGATGYTMLIYGLVDPGLITKVGFTTGFAGVVVCANTYLLTEFALRPIAARALTSSPPRKSSGVGITMRALLIALWGGLPVAGLMIIAIFALAGAPFTVVDLARAILFLGGITLVVGLMLTWFNTRSMVAPIRSVTSAMRDVQRGKLDREVIVFDGTELGMLQSGFNRMVHDVRERQTLRDLFGRHVGEEVAKAALENKLELGGEVRDVAVLFIDLVGSTTIAAERPPTEVVDLLNQFFAVVVAEVHAHGGFVNKFEGDAALAIFGAPEDLPDAAGRALAAARVMAARLTVEVPDALAGIGVSAGPAVAGNVGAQDRFEYTVIGDPVNEAARLTEEAKKVEGRVVASMRAVDAASAEEQAQWAPLHEVHLRGRLEPTLLAVPR
ncbi:MAG: adenylate/guanylate cyclase domain-containing protein [Aeromicrobium sp.]